MAVSRSLVAHLTDEDDVRVLAQHGAHAHGEVGGIDAISRWLKTLLSSL
jgi:hypothetical protein